MTGAWLDGTSEFSDTVLAQERENAQALGLQCKLPGPDELLVDDRRQTPHPDTNCRKERVSIYS